MKGLMSLAKEKRKELSSINSSQNDNNSVSKLNQFSNKSSSIKNPKDLNNSADLDYEEEEDYEPSIEEVCAYAEFIGIQLPQEENLLWIAKEGLQAELPSDWEEGETENGEVVYQNMHTGQVIFEHPCDDYYKQLVIKERSKSSSKVSKPAVNLSLKNKSMGIGNIDNHGSFQPIGRVSNGNESGIQLREEPPVDPLVKMQREKEQKRQQEQLKKQFDDKKSQLKKTYQKKEDDLAQDYKQKEQRAQEKYDEELRAYKRDQRTKMSQQQQENQRKKEQELTSYEKELKKKEEDKLQQKLAKEKTKIAKKFEQKKQALVEALEKKLKEQKRQIDQQFNEKHKKLQQRERKIAQEGSEISGGSVLDEQISSLKSEIVRKKMNKYSKQIKEETEKQNQILVEQMAQMEAEHAKRIKGLQEKSSSDASSGNSGAFNKKAEQLIREIESFEKEEMKILEYQLNVMRDLKKIENEEKLEEYKYRLHQLQKERLSKVSQDIEEEFERFKALKKDEFQVIITESEKKAKSDFLNGLKSLQKRFEREEEMIMIENYKPKQQSEGGSAEAAQLEELELVYQKFEFEQKQMKRERENLQKEIERLRNEQGTAKSQLVKGVSSPLSRMTSQQAKLYQLIQDKIRKVE